MSWSRCAPRKPFEELTDAEQVPLLLTRFVDEDVGKLTFYWEDECEVLVADAVPLAVDLVPFIEQLESLVENALRDAGPSL